MRIRIGRMLRMGPWYRYAPGRGGAKWLMLLESCKAGELVADLDDAVSDLQLPLIIPTLLHTHE